MKHGEVDKFDAKNWYIDLPAGVVYHITIILRKNVILGIPEYEKLNL